MSIRFDGPSQTAISLRSSTSSNSETGSLSSVRLVELQILVKGDITEIALRGEWPSEEEHLICADSNFLTVRQSTTGSMKQSSCSIRLDEENFCNCRGPNSALKSGPGIAACSAPKVEEGGIKSPYF